MVNYDYIIVGSGFAGGVSASRLACAGKRVLVLEKRPHVGGNAYDTNDDHGILVHKYGPHIFHTDSTRVYEYLSQYTEWKEYEHKVMARAGAMEFPVPFNLNSLYAVFGSEAPVLERKLLERYGEGKRLSIAELRSDQDPEIRRVADFVFENVFLNYTVKQWGKHPEEIDPETLSRVPIYISRDDRYFHDKYQGLPKNGYTPLFEALLDHENIEVRLCCDAKEHISFSDSQIFFDSLPFEGGLIYTGAIDALFDYEYGCLPYRTLDFKFENHPVEYYQSHATVNYTVDKPYTRITEFKHLTGQKKAGITTIVKEYSRACTDKDGDIPYYAVINDESNSIYVKYLNKAKSYKNLILLGRLAEYKYYNMDRIVELALELCDTLLSS